MADSRSTSYNLIDRILRAGKYFWNHLDSSPLDWTRNTNHLVRLESNPANRRDPTVRLEHDLATSCDLTDLGHRSDPSPAIPTYPFDPFSLSLHDIQNHSTFPIPITLLFSFETDAQLALNHSRLDLCLLESLDPYLYFFQPEHLTIAIPILPLLLSTRDRPFNSGEPTLNLFLSSSPHHLTHSTVVRRPGLPDLLTEPKP